MDRQRPGPPNLHERVPAGHDLDRLVAEKALGARVIARRARGTYDLLIPGLGGRLSVDWVEAEGAWSGVPPFSENTERGWKEMQGLIAHLHREGWAVDLDMRADRTEAICYRFDPNRAHGSWAPTTPHALCLVVLLAAGVAL